MDEDSAFYGIFIQSIAHFCLRETHGVIGDQEVIGQPL